MRGKRVGVYGLDYVMTVRDYAALAGAGELVGWDVAFDHARMVKSELELASVRESVRINTEGFWIFLEHFEPGKTEREVLAPCEEYFVAQGCGRWTMDMVLDGPNGSALPEFKIAGAQRVRADRLRAAVARGRRPRRALGRGLARDLPWRAERRHEAHARGLRGVLRGSAGRAPRRRTARDAHRAVAKGFLDRGFHLGHVTGHSIGMTMIEFPKVGEHDETELQAGMVLSMHPHAISQDGKACLYMQDTWLVTDDGRRAPRRPPDEDLRRNRTTPESGLVDWSTASSL